MSFNIETTIYPNGTSKVTKIQYRGRCISTFHKRFRRMILTDFSNPILVQTFDQIKKNHGNAVDAWPEKVRANFINQVMKVNKTQQSNLIGANKNA